MRFHPSLLLLPFLAVLAWLAWPASDPAPAQTPAAKSDDVTSIIVPFVTKNCIDCHGPKKKKADLALHVFTDSASILNSHATATVTATAPAIGTRTGTVAFNDGGIAIAGCAAQVLAAAGTATCATNALTAGVHTITAVYSGDGNFTTSTSAPLTQTVLTTTTTSVVPSSQLGQAWSAPAEPR